MAKGIFDKEYAPNKRIVQEIIYTWIQDRFKNRNFPTTIIMLPGDNPTPTLNMYKQFFYKPIIHAFEKNINTFIHLKSQIDTLKNLIDFRLKYGNVTDILFEGMAIEDLDFCTNFFSSRRRRIPYVYFKDTFSILQKRLALMANTTRNFNYEKVFMFTVTLRNGLGKASTYHCLQALVYQLGWKLDYIDYENPAASYGKGTIIEGSGCLHSNGQTYYAYEHKIQLSGMTHINPYSKHSIYARMFTYTDGQPMLTFVLMFK